MSRYARDWRFYKTLSAWIKRAGTTSAVALTPPSSSTDAPCIEDDTASGTSMDDTGVEHGIYYVFDVSTWSVCTREMCVEVHHVETLPPMCLPSSLPHHP